MKHAFLIMAHTNWSLLERLLRRLDFEDSHIYLHIDAKSEVSDTQLKEITDVCQNAAFTLVPRMKVNWGGYSQIACELALLKSAVPDGHDYYHFLSGIDYPLVSKQAFQDFFHANAGKEFIGFSEKGFAERERQRYQVYHFFQEKAGRSKSSAVWLLEHALVKLQVKSHLVDRTRGYKDVRFEMGSNWCSLTGEFAAYLLSQEKLIEKMFRQSSCCDEFFVQTIFVNSPFKDRNFQRADGTDEANTQNLRAIDWKRGNPYTFDCRDYEALMASGNLFARKVGNDTPEREKLLDLIDAATADAAL